MAEPTNQGTSTGSADTGAQQPGNVDLLQNAFAGATGGEPAAQPATGDAAGGTGTGGTIPKLAPWAEQLPEDIRGNAGMAAKLAAFGKIGDLAKAYLEAEGKQTAFPKENATAEEVAAFWKKAGKPDTPEGYGFIKEQGGAEIAAAAHSANLTAGQADALFKSLTGQAAQQLKAVQEGQTRQIQETSAALQKEYGDKYPQKMQLLSRGLKAAGPNVSAILAKAGLAGNPEIVKAMIAFGDMTAESSAPTGGAVTGQPLTSVLQGGWYNYKNS